MLKDTNIRQELEGLILNTLDEKPRTRVELIQAVTEKYCHSKKIKASHTVGCLFMQVKSYVGIVVNDCVQTQKIEYLDSLYRLREDTVNLTSVNYLPVLLKLLKKGKRSKKDIFFQLDKHFGTDKTASKRDDNQLHSMVGQLLEDCVRDGALLLVNGFYSLPTRQAPATAVTANIDQLLEQLLETLHDKGGSFFEGFVCGLLEQYYGFTDKSVTHCSVVGGSADGGIDCVIDTVDELGFSEHILIQCKCRRSALVTEKEVREFIGAVSIQEGTRGIFVTTAAFHPNATKLLQGIPHCVGIDGEHVKRLVKKTNYGIKRVSANTYALDATVLAL